MTDQRISTQIIEAVAETTGVDPLELPPLYETIDPETLNALVTDSEFGQSGSLNIVRFAYAGYMVAVYGDQTVEVTDTVANGAESTAVSAGTGD